MKTTDIESRPNLLIPEEKAPVCYAMGCLFHFVAGDVSRADDPTQAPFDIFSMGGTSLVHTPRSGKPSAFFVPNAWLVDVERPLWAEIQPWIEQLHAEEPA